VQLVEGAQEVRGLRGAAVGGQQVGQVGLKKLDKSLSSLTTRITMPLTLPESRITKASTLMKWEYVGSWAILLITIQSG